MDPISDYQLGDGPGVTAAVGNLYLIFSNRGGRQAPIGRRVRSWLRMNAGGAPNTCKSNGTHPRVEASGERLSNTWRTHPLHRDSPGKPGVIPDRRRGRMARALKPRREGTAPRPIR